ncbi:DJ-1/PfpI family protein [Candidatus Bathyarchaeota archaeon]|nr:DJ-1/PfpI family protein [Candidatus Bathyarchaeota archaeon]
MRVSSKKRILFLIAHEGFNDRELLDPKAILEDRGIEVDIASTLAGECRGMGGTKVMAPLAIDDVKPYEYDGIVIVGGLGAKIYLSGNAKVHALLKSFYKAGKLVAAIGRGRHALSEVGLFGENFSYGPKVEIRGHVIAARPPATTPGWTSKDFGRLLADHLMAPSG